jgi:hypothetical protein
MTTRALIIAQSDEHLALRLVSSLVLGWDLIPLATQGRLLHDASLMANGTPDAITLPAQLLAFIDANKSMRS